MFIHAASIVTTKPDQDKKILEKELKSLTGFKIRRVNRFILLALLGAHRCMANRQIDTSAAVYLTTENGSVGGTEEILVQLYHRHDAPMPYAFINTMCNTASFYVARNLNISGKNFVISSRGFSFERGLELIRTDFQLGRTHEALIGGVDEAVLFDERAARMSETDKKNLIDGSAWLYLSDNETGAIGRILAVNSFHDMESAYQHIGQTEFADKYVFSFGERVSETEKKHWRKNDRFGDEFDFIGEIGSCNSLTACVVSSFIEKSESACLAHVNRNDQSRYVAVLVRKY